MEKDCVNCKNSRICVMFKSIQKIQYETALLKDFGKVRQVIAETCDLYQEEDAK